MTPRRIDFTKYLPQYVESFLFCQLTFTIVDYVHSSVPGWDCDYFPTSRARKIPDLAHSRFPRVGKSRAPTARLVHIVLHFRNLVALVLHVAPHDDLFAHAKTEAKVL